MFDLSVDFEQIDWLSIVVGSLKSGGNFAHKNMSSKLAWASVKK